ncbi:MAG: glycosyl hydrolase [Leeuwenhoekiella sp.]
MSNRHAIQNISALVLLLFTSCVFNANKEESNTSANDTNTLYNGFQNPPSEARPFVRWWWNDNDVEPNELDRELELLKSVGFGGVEINPIAANRTTKKYNPDAMVWMSDEWIDMLVHACKKSKDLGMITDMIVGTGWPFGGEFLKHEETCQRITPHTLPYNGNTTIKTSKDELLDIINTHYEGSGQRKHQSEKTTYELFYIYLIPNDCKDKNEAINLLDFVDKEGNLSYEIKTSGKYNLCYGFKEQSFRKVSSGAKGGAGPVMNHYDKDVTRQYLSRIKKVSEKTGIPLSDLVRALFCDSIEISGANWTDGFKELFDETYGYSFDDWLPFVFYPAYEGYEEVEYDADFKDRLKRVRYDYNRLLVDTFLENFTQVSQDFCEENGLKYRYQAYGTPFLMGMLEGYMIPDIPESNNWVYSQAFESDRMKDSVWTWSQGHGYMLWNMMAASGGHLTGKNIISCETMTNTNGVFRTTLQEIKQHDDMNFITGINHSILHGFNYSPPEASFPGWLKFGTYFSEHNPWWEHLHKWVDYNARLSYVFQNSQAEKSIAIIGPTADLWGDVGLTRSPYHSTPEYLFRLWEPISQLGYSNEYINQQIIQDAEINDGVITYGNMKYKLLVLASLTSIEPETATALKAFVESGGKVVVVDQLPVKSLNFIDYKENDNSVKVMMESLVEKYPESILIIDGPESLDNLFVWTKDVLNKTGLAPDVTIDTPHEYVYQMHQYTGDKVVYFFNNSHRFKTSAFDATFPIEGKYPYVWNPETGERKPYAYTDNSNKLNIELNPLESLLLVYEDEKPKESTTEKIGVKKELTAIEGVWIVEGKRVDGEVLNWEMDKLIDFSKSGDSTQSTFGGKIIYKTVFNAPKGTTHIDLGEVNQGVTQLFINGKDAGTRWYGQAIYPIADFIVEGENTIEIHYSTVLTNYAKSLKDNPGAQHWARHGAIAPTGIEGDVTLISYTE